MPVTSEPGKQALTIESLKDDPRWQAVQRIVSSPSFSKAARLAAFLNYICERTLLGRCEEINEQQVGVHVFGRPADYNPAADNIVRGTARQLRQRLAVYYQEEGLGESIRIAVPRGAYIPIFELPPATGIEDPVEPPAAFPEPERPVAPSTSRISRSWWFAIIPLSLSILFAFWIASPTPVDRFWQLVFSRDRKTFLVPGDSGFVMFQNLTGKSVTVSEYAAGSYRANAVSGKVDPLMLDSLSSRRYTSFADLKFATRLVARPQVIRDRLEIRYARDLRVDDLKQSNAVLVGAPQGNPWTGIFCRELDFCIASDEAARSLTVVNRAPLAGERNAYTYSAYDPAQHAFATIALTDNLDHSGKVLVVGGTTVAGIDAAADFLFNDSLMKPLVEEWMKAGGPANRFELLIETSGVAANGSTIKLIAKHLGNPPHPSH